MSGPESAPRPPPPPRRLRCVRCRHHGSVVPLKGHARTCPFSSCTCLKCTLVTQRTKITAGDRKRVRPPAAAATATAASQKETKPSAPELRPRPGPPPPPGPGGDAVMGTQGAAGEVRTVLACWGRPVVHVLDAAGRRQEFLTASSMAIHPSYLANNMSVVTPFPPPSYHHLHHHPLHLQHQQPSLAFPIYRPGGPPPLLSTRPLANTQIVLPLHPPGPYPGDLLPGPPPFFRPWQQQKPLQLMSLFRPTP